MNLYMNLPGVLLTACLIQPGWGITIKLSLGWRFGLINNADCQFRNGSVSTRTRTRRNGPELLPTLPISPFPFMGLLTSSCFRSIYLSGPRICARARYKHTFAVERPVPVGSWSSPVAWFSGWGDCSPSVLCLKVQCFPLLSLAPPVLFLTFAASLHSLSPVYFCWQVHQWWLWHPRTPAPPGHIGLILLSQCIAHINHCQLFVSISERIRVGCTTTISGIPKDLAIVDTAAACPTVDCTPAQLCPSQSQGSSKLQSVNSLKWSPLHLVQCCSTWGH